MDGDYQYYSVSPGNIQREHWVEGNPELERMMDSLTDEEIREIKRGGQDPKKIFAAFHRASRSHQKPTVMLVKTVKGDGMGPSAQGRNTAHQKKNLNTQERLQCARDYGIPMDEEAIQRADFYRPDETTEEWRYLNEHRQDLGGFLPERQVDCPSIEAPPLEPSSEFLQGSGKRAASTTSAMVRMLARMLTDDRIGKNVVPIVPDEARTFGMDGLFKVAGIYSAEGQNYTPVDADSLLSYREAEDGQILQEGISETGAMASFMAAGTAYAVHGLPMIPFYIFYSMFGFQRVGDMIWSCADMMCRGFLLGGTAGRTTLSGEGLQHQAGHSHILANTYPNLKSYDPSFAFELALIVREGIRRMYQEQENIFYYITLYNENYPMPKMPAAESVTDGVLRGAYCFQRSQRTGEKVHLLSSGAIMQQALGAAQRLEAMGYAVDVWSITSFNELYREADACERWNRLHSLQPPRTPYVRKLFEAEQGIAVAATDYMKALPNCIARWMLGAYTTLGTDGFGISESRQPIRDFFEVSADYIAQASLAGLYRDHRIDKATLRTRMAALDIDTGKVNPATR